MVSHGLCHLFLRYSDKEDNSLAFIRLHAHDSGGSVRLSKSGAPGRTRTDTGRILSPLSLPLDYGGHEQVLRQFT